MAPMEAMTDTWSWRLFWRAADQRDYLVTLVRLHILDALAGPLPETGLTRPSTPWGVRNKDVDTRVKPAQDDLRSFPASLTQVRLAGKLSPGSPALSRKRRINY
jgi:hypothetical protein